MTPDANCRSVNVEWFSDVGPLWAAFAAMVADAIVNPSSVPLVETGSVLYSSHRALRAERRRNNMKIEAYVFAHRGVAQDVGGHVPAIPLACFAKSVPQVLAVSMSQDAWSVGSPDARLAEWSSLVAPTVRAFLADWATGSSAPGSEVEQRESTLVSAVRYQPIVKVGEASIVAFVSLARSAGAVATGNVTQRAAGQPEAATLPIAEGSSAQLGRIADAVSELAQMDYDLALNSGEIIYSIRAREMTQP